MTIRECKILMVICNRERISILNLGSGKVSFSILKQFSHFSCFLGETADWPSLSDYLVYRVPEQIDLLLPHTSR